MKRILDYRQGDVGFVRGKIPTSAKRIAVRPFAYGERTGHTHCVVDPESVEMYEDNGIVWVCVVGDAPTKHQEHDRTGQNSVLAKGWEGEVRICGEYDEEQDFRPVTD